ncbi:zinc metalloprotease HtpX family protein [Enterobacter cloacae subsp. cloacae]|nr:zinc metalloprotease HtpX family protein [Enterobacter cloacae]MBN4758735.1 PLDc N-terminal domain-containing protein [Enterobacter cloacae]MCK6804939.1 zinc metalloprotease HtpX family protein [Enterobacter cloacae]MCK6827639.1 zinc metalloprotease HtpX family protein [Enterobacter cloacae]MCM7172119.1 zinc metalloprotease HtpX family protein [Enterobacter cloacae]MCU6309268.1 PLDc N-terminal domain-containing protein [Enterobacter cloacae]
MTTHLLQFWNMAATLFSIFFFIAYLFVIFQIVTDLFRDNTLNGFFKSLWIMLLLFIPLITSVFYLILRGKGMAKRQRAYRLDANAAAQYSLCKSPAEQISDAKRLLDQDVISQEEFELLKKKAIN